MLTLNFIYPTEFQIYFILVVLVIAVFGLIIGTRIKRDNRKKQDERITRELLEMNEERNREKLQILSEIAKTLKIDKDSLIIERVKKNQSFISTIAGASYFYAYCNNDTYLIEFSNGKVSKVTKNRFFERESF